MNFEDAEMFKGGEIDEPSPWIVWFVGWPNGASLGAARLGCQQPGQKASQKNQPPFEGSGGRIDQDEILGFTFWRKIFSGISIPENLPNLGVPEIFTQPE